MMDAARKGRAWIARLASSEFVAVDVDTGRFVCGESVAESVKAARQSMPDATLYVDRRDGSPAYTLHTPGLI